MQATERAASWATASSPPPASPATRCSQHRETGTTTTTRTWWREVQMARCACFAATVAAVFRTPTAYRLDPDGTLSTPSSHPEPPGTRTTSATCWPALLTVSYTHLRAHETR